MHGSAGEILGAIKQTKNRARLLLATPQCRLAFIGREAGSGVGRVSIVNGVQLELHDFSSFHQSAVLF